MTGFYGSKDPTNSVIALKEDRVLRIRLQSYRVHHTVLQYDKYAAWKKHMAPFAVWMGLKDRQQWRHVYSSDRPWDNYHRSTMFANGWRVGLCCVCIGLTLLNIGYSVRSGVNADLLL